MKFKHPMFEKVIFEDLDIVLEISLVSGIQNIDDPDFEGSDFFEDEN